MPPSSDAAQEILMKFHLQAAKLKPYFDSFKGLSFEVTIDETEQRVTSSGLDERDLPAILLHFRNIYMESSGLSFSHIVSAILQDSSCIEHHQRSKEFLDVWHQLLDKKRESFNGLVLGIDDSSWNIRKNFDVWLNEAYFHADKYTPGSGKGLDAVKSHPVFEGVSKFVMQDLLQRLCMLILAFDAQVVEKIV